MVGGAAVVAGSQAVAVWAAVSARRTVTLLEQRTSALADALVLLTETSESGFHAVATEVMRHGSGRPARAAAQRSATSRVRAAARRGATPSDIAVQEGVSEGEVRLRLHLGDASAAQGGRQ
jgi:hypothetical protein